MPDIHPPILWKPSAETIQHAHLSRYMDWLRQHASQFRIPADLDTYPALWQWSVDQPADFWASFWQYFDIISHTPYSRVLSGVNMPGCRWFEGATLNYAEHVFRKKNDTHPAILFQRENTPLTTVSWQELERSTADTA